MKIKLNEIEFSNEQIIQYLIHYGYKIEPHKVTSMSIVGSNSLKTDCKFAIPLNEEYDPKKHKSMNDTFKTIFEDNIRNFLLNL